MSAAPSSHYVKIWFLLLVLLIISVCGPMLEHPVITIITAFGIAGVKAYIVAAKFMHLEVEKKYITYMLLTMLAFMALFFAGTAPDVMTPGGNNWKRMELDQSKAAVHAHEAGNAHEETSQH